MVERNASGLDSSFKPLKVAAQLATAGVAVYVINRIVSAHRGVGWQQEVAYKPKERNVFTPEAEHYLTTHAEKAKVIVAVSTHRAAMSASQDAEARVLEDESAGR